MTLSAAAASRIILTRLHDVMAARRHAQAKLNQVVEIIGEGLDSEVCSIYLLREGMLELFATRGLEQSAVHITRMAVGEGLVGTIADKPPVSSSSTRPALTISSDSTIATVCKVSISTSS